MRLGVGGSSSSSSKKKKKGGWVSPGIYQNPGGGVIRTPNPGPIPRGNSYVSRYTPPASGWMDTSVRSGGTQQGSIVPPPAAPGGAPGGSAPGGGGGRGPKPPKPPKKLSYKQLLAMVNGDPGLVRQLALFDQKGKNIRSRATQNIGLANTAYEGELAALGRQRDETSEAAMEEAAAMGRLRSGVYADRAEDILADYQENKGRLGRQKNLAVTGYQQGRQEAIENLRERRQAARENAINRLLAQRTDITRRY